MSNLGSDGSDFDEYKNGGRIFLDVLTDKTRHESHVAVYYRYQKTEYSGVFRREFIQDGKLEVELTLGDVDRGCAMVKPKNGYFDQREVYGILVDSEDLYVEID